MLLWALFAHHRIYPVEGMHHARKIAGQEHGTVGEHCGQTWVFFYQFKVSLLVKSCADFHRWAAKRTIHLVWRIVDSWGFENQEAGCPKTNPKASLRERAFVKRLNHHEKLALCQALETLSPKVNGDRLPIAFLAPLASFSIHLTLLSWEGWHHFLNYSLKVFRIRLTWTDWRGLGITGCFVEEAMKFLMARKRKKILQGKKGRKFGYEKLGVSE